MDLRSKHTDEGEFSIRETFDCKSVYAPALLRFLVAVSAPCDSLNSICNCHMSFIESLGTSSTNATECMRQNNSQPTSLSEVLHAQTDQEIKM